MGSGWANRSGCALAALALLLAGAACASPYPRVRPDLRASKEEARQARKDWSECVAEGERFRRSQQGEIAGNVVEETVVRGAEAGAAGAVVRDAARGAAAGAAAGAAGSIVRGLFRSQRLNPAVAEVTRRCLERRGYEVED
jgi:hypothetical protein